MAEPLKKDGKPWVGFFRNFRTTIRKLIWYSVQPFRQFFPAQKQLARQRNALLHCGDQGALKVNLSRNFWPKKAYSLQRKLHWPKPERNMVALLVKGSKSSVKQLPGFMIYMLMTCLWSKSSHFTNTKSNEPTKTNTHTQFL